jgi:predicted TIM-barrel fold metal-dependent hydrolase
MNTLDGAPIVDAHHHLWCLSCVRYPWLEELRDSDNAAEDLGSLRRDYLIDDFLADAGPSRVVRSVHIQADSDPADPVAETRWLQAIADVHGFPHGIVAFVPLNADDAQATLEAHCQFANVRGVRQMMNRDKPASQDGAPADQCLTDPAWRRGFALLARYRLSFDLHIYPWQLEEAADLAHAFSETPIAIDHVGLPLARDRAARQVWRRGMTLIARYPNVALKVSGLAMLDHASPGDRIGPVMAEAIEIFGPERCMFGSNFPVDRIYSSFGRLVSTFRDAIAQYSPSEQRSMLRDNAAAFYRLS